jgi:glycine betaine/proline transport system permease protein
MDPISQWVVDHKIPIGQWGKEAFSYLTTNFEWFFDGIARGMSFVLEGINAGMLWLPPPVLILIAAGSSWFLRRTLVLPLGIAAGLLWILNMGYWKETVETLTLVAGATAASMAIGVPVGIMAAHRPAFFKVLRPILDLMQTLPTFCYLIPVLVLFGLGIAPGLIVTVIFAVAAPIRLTHLGISTVPRQLVEAGEAFGATKRQLLWKVELPAAMPSIMEGLTQCIMLSLSMVVIAALIGASGLGKPVVRALNSLNIPMGIEAGIAIVLMAIMLDRVCRSQQDAARENRS